MKQSLPFGGTRKATVLALVVAQMLFGAGCVKQPRRYVEPQPVDKRAENAINLNTATAQELETLPGIGKATAEKIVAHREQYGSFRRPEHLLMVQGISDQKFRAIRSRIKTE